MGRKGRPRVETCPENPALQWGPRRFGDAGRAPGLRRRRLLAAAFTAAVHLAALSALIFLHTKAPPAHVGPPPMELSLVELPKPNPPGPPDATEPEAGIPKSFLQLAEPRATAPVLAYAETPDMSDLLSESQLAGAARAGEGGGGGVCDMALILQQALRRDPLVHIAVAQSNRAGKAILLWNGDWVRSGDQDGKGLSAVREAILWEVAFAPEACRNLRVHGLVLLTLADSGTRFAIGAGDWRWSDLLGLRRISPER
jgi:hypothetical protein